MKIKRLNHAAQNICQIFCGWRLNRSLQRIAELGSGVLDIDVLSGQCTFNESPIESLPIAKEIRGWFLDDLNQSGIPVSGIRSACLRAELQLSRIPWNQGGEIFFKGNTAVVTPQTNRCQMHCMGVITTDAKQFQGTYNADRKWPLGWPAD
jgi:hypothetical protein